MIRLPKSFKLGAHTFKVKRTSEEALHALCGEPAWGCFVPHEQTIYIYDLASDSQALVTYYHELMHAINWVLGIKDDSEEAHRNVDLIGQSLAQVVQSCKF